MKRFAIYNDVKALLRMLINDSHKVDFDNFAVTQHYVTIDEAIFFFRPELCTWLQVVQSDCQKFLEARAARSTPQGYDPREADCRKLLYQHFRALQGQFQNELSFRQLTRSPSH